MEIIADARAVIQDGYCHCGCGNRTGLATRNRSEVGWIKGQPLAFIKGHNSHGGSQHLHFWDRVKKGAPDECWEWQGRRDIRGYGICRGSHGGRAHRLAFFLANGTLDMDLFVLHKCDNPPCCNPAHLYQGTNVDNTRDQVARNRTLRGSGHNMAKLSEADVMLIREALSRGAKLRTLAEQYGVCLMSISNIKRRRSWRHI